MLSKAWQYLEEALTAALLIAMCAAAVLKVASRYLGPGELSWAEELITLLFVYLVFIGAALALKHSDHFAVDILVQKLPPPAALPLKLLANALVILFAALLTWFGLTLAVTGHSSVTPALELPRSVPYAAVPLGGILMLIRALELTARNLRPGRPAAAKLHQPTLPEDPNT